MHVENPRLRVLNTEKFIAIVSMELLDMAYKRRFLLLYILHLQNEIRGCSGIIGVMVHSREQ